MSTAVKPTFGCPQPHPHCHPLAPQIFHFGMSMLCLLLWFTSMMITMISIAIVCSCLFYMFNEGYLRSLPWAHLIYAYVCICCLFTGAFISDGWACSHCVSMYNSSLHPTWSLHPTSSKTCEKPLASSSAQEYEVPGASKSCSYEVPGGHGKHLNHVSHFQTNLQQLSHRTYLTTSQSLPNNFRACHSIAKIFTQEETQHDHIFKSAIYLL